MIEREGQFLIDRFRGDPRLVKRQYPEHVGIGLESNQLNACIEEAKRQGYLAVFGSSSFGFQEDNLDALQHLPLLRRISFWDVALNSVDGVYSLSELAHFRVAGKRPPVNFSHLPKLEQLMWEWKPRDTGVETLQQLRVLHLWRYKSKSGDMSGVTIPTGVQELELNFPTAESLDGMPVMPALRHLEIHYARKLTSVAEIPRLFPNLTYLVVDKCPHVADGAATLKQMSKLEHGYVQGLLAKPSEIAT
jgi:hypothetical protein